MKYGKFVVGILTAALMAVQTVHAQTAPSSRWVDYFSVYFKTMNINMLLTHNATQQILVSERTTKSLFFLNAQTERVGSQMGIGKAAADMALSKDPKQQFLAIAYEEGGIGIFDLFKPAGAMYIKTIPLPANLAGYTVSSVAFLSDGSLAFSLAPLPGQYYIPQWTPVYRLDISTGAILSSIAGTQNGYYKGALVRTSERGTDLYIGERGLSPLSVERVTFNADMTAQAPIRTKHGEVGSNLHDMVVAANRLYLVSGAPYGIQEVSPATMRLSRIIPTTHYPNAIASSIDGRNVFSTSDNWSARLLYRAPTVGGSTATYPLAKVPDTNYYFVNYSTALPRGLAISPDGTKAFVVTGVASQPSLGHRIQVITTEIAPVCELSLVETTQRLSQVCSLANASSDSLLRTQVEPLCR